MRIGIPTYGRVLYQEIYPDIDLVFYGAAGQLEYDSVVAPGADPDVIALDFDGALDTTIEASGDLLIRTASGEVRWQAPRLYQEWGGERHDIDGVYTIRGPGLIGFTVGSYDRNLPLVIDPVLDYTTYFGGLDADLAYGIALDPAKEGLAFVISATRLPPTIRFRRHRWTIRRTGARTRS